MAFWWSFDGKVVSDCIGSYYTMFDGVYRGSYPLLKAAIDLTIQLTNMKIKLAPPR